MVDVTDEQAALLRLRQQMLDFVVDELARRAADGRDPALSSQLTDAVRAQVDQAVKASMAAAQRAEGQEIARHVVDATEQRQAGLLAAIADIGREKTVLSVRPQPDDGGRRRDIVPSSDPAPAAGFTLREAVKSPVAIVAALLLVAAIVFAWLYLDQRAARQAAFAEATTVLGQKNATICDIRTAIEGEYRLIQDSPAFKSECQPRNGIPSKSQLCVTAAQLAAWHARLPRTCAPVPAASPAPASAPAP